jgi:hypothetical protein
LRREHTESFSIKKEILPGNGQKKTPASAMMERITAEKSEFPLPNQHGLGE